MFLLGLFLVFGAATGIYINVDNFLVFIDKEILHRVIQITQGSDYLDLSAYPVQNIAANCFAAFRGLKSLALKIKLDESQFIEHLPPLVFRFLSNLEYLSLANSNIRKIEYAFWGLRNLQVLDLRNSNITLNRGSFFGISNATNILLAGSNVLDVKPEYFLEPSPLMGMCMTGSVVRSIGLFQSMLNMTKHCDVQWVPTYYYKLVLDSRDIVQFGKGWYRITDSRIKVLSLFNNQIRDLSSNLINDLSENVVYLNLAWNKIKSIEGGKIDNPNLHVLDLTGNPIVHIDATAFAMTKLKRLVLTLHFMKYLPTSVESLTLFANHEKRNYTLTMLDLTRYD